MSTSQQLTIVDRASIATTQEPRVRGITHSRARRSSAVAQGLTPSTANRLCIIAITAFAAILVGLFVPPAASVFVKPVDGTSTQIVLAIFTRVVGCLASIFALSSVAKLLTSLEQRDQ